jgi:ribosomal protein L3 glutamine methyltransferase
LRVIRRIIAAAPRHLTERGGMMCEVGRGRAAVEGAYPDQRFLWLDTEESSGEVFWIDRQSLGG